MRYLALCTFALLTACGLPSGTPPGAEPAPPLPTPENDTCGALPYAHLIGQSDTALERELIMRQVRVIRPGDAVTMDFVPARINFVIGPADEIQSIYCG